MFKKDLNKFVQNEIDETLKSIIRPNLIVNQLVSVQPLPPPSSLIFYLKYQYNKLIAFKIGDIVKITKDRCNENIDLSKNPLFKIIKIDKYGDLELKDLKENKIIPGGTIFDLNVWSVFIVTPIEIAQWRMKNNA